MRTSYSNQLSKLEDNINSRIYPYKIKHEFIKNRGYNLMLYVLRQDGRMFNSLGFVRSPFNFDANGIGLFAEGLLRDELALLLLKLSNLDDNNLFNALNIRIR